MLSDTRDEKPLSSLLKRSRACDRAAIEPNLLLGERNQLDKEVDGPVEMLYEGFQLDMNNLAFVTRHVELWILNAARGSRSVAQCTPPAAGWKLCVGVLPSSVI